LAGKPYPTTAPSPPTPPTTPPADDTATADRLDKVLFALRQLQGQVQDVLMTLDEMRGIRRASPALKKKKPAPAKRTASSARKTGKRRTRS
jgi:hypothetical protein